MLVKEADGVHEYTVSEGFKFQTNGQSVGVADLQPGMSVNAVVTDKTGQRHPALRSAAQK